MWCQKKKIMRKCIFLGQFKCESGKIRITDPCYNMETRGVKSVDAPKGWWDAFVTRTDETNGWGTRNVILEVYLSGFNGRRSDFYYLTKTGVDSGQCGFFDEDDFRINCDSESWYDKICQITLNGDDAGITPDCRGAVSASGFGDGEYICEVSYDADTHMPVAFRLTFDDPFNNYEDEDEEW